MLLSTSKVQTVLDFYCFQGLGKLQALKTIKYLGNTTNIPSTLLILTSETKCLLGG